MSGWSEITGENLRFELHRGVVERKGKKKKKKKTTRNCSGLSLEAYNLKFLSEKHSLDWLMKRSAEITRGGLRLKLGGCAEKAKILNLFSSLGLINWKSNVEEQYCSVIAATFYTL